MLLEWLAKMGTDKKGAQKQVDAALLNVQQLRVQKELERMAASDASQPRVQNNGIRAESASLQRKELLSQEAINNSLRAAQSRFNIL